MIIHQYKEDDFSRLELNLNNCVNNYRYFRSLLESDTKLLILLKANAYGHGSVEFASMMQKIGADYFGVAHPIEGIELRQAGISIPILVLTAGCDFNNEIIDYKLEPGIPNLTSLITFTELLKARHIENYPVHIKLDTGMHRLGFMPNEIDELIDYIKDNQYIRVQSIYSHLAVSENPDEDDFTLSQIKLFETMANKIKSVISYKPLLHILNSSGIERFSQFQFDMVRLGIGIYGISCLPNNTKLKPVASLKCKIIQTKDIINIDDTIGYGRKGKAKNNLRIATIPVGYADGIDRHLGCGNAQFNYNGVRVPTIGNICMDMCMIDISNTNAKVGDTITIFGDDPKVEELAKILDTIPYEILTRISNRIERVVIRK